MTHALHAKIWKDRFETDPYPWYFEVDFVTPEFPKGDRTMDSADYGRVESFAIAMEAVEAVLAGKS